MERIKYTFNFSNLALGLFTVLIFTNLCLGNLDICDRRPFKTNTDSLSPDDRFEIEIEGISDKYIPHQRYNVRLYSKDNKTTFMGFSIWLREHEVDNEKNKRRPRRLDPGRLHPSPDSPGGMSHPSCNNTVIQVDITPKTSVQALWTAPGKNSYSVTINAIVAIKPDVWYANEGPLSKRVVEDNRDADDILPTQNDDCQVCEEARYQLTFIGLWSKNTHVQMFPKDNSLARFSDIVGASHSQSFVMYKSNSEASPGIQMLAEQGNTTDLELEIQKELGLSVRTVVKASAPAKTDSTTVTSFRVSKEKHFVSLATGIMPSPDWFLGVANLELCKENRERGSEWSPTVTLNLYPFDAGTDSGKDFESSNDKTSPPQPISSLYKENSPQGKKKAFARIRFDLIRTYPNPNCSTENPSTNTDEGEGDEEGNPTDEEEDEQDEGGKEDEDEQEENKYVPTKNVDYGRPEPPERTPEVETTTEGSVEGEIVSTEYGNCLMTPWEDWGCKGRGPCEDGTKAGLMMKFRYHIVDDKVIGKDDDSDSDKRIKEVPDYCMVLDTSLVEKCRAPCEEETTEEPMEK